MFSSLSGIASAPGWSAASRHSVGLLDTTDAELPRLLAGHPKAVLMLTTAHCAICEQLWPVFALFATNPAYAGLAFLHVNADEDPTTRQHLVPHVPPVFVGYEQGRVVGSDSLFTEQQLRRFLNALQARP